MKKFMLLVFVTMSLCATGQNNRMNEKRKEKLEAQRVAFITQKLDLTPEESQKFWGIYNEHMNKEQELKRAMRDLREDIPSMSESEADQAIKSWIENGQREMDLRKNTYYQLRKVLPANKLVKLPLAERQFKEKLLQQVGNRMKERRNMQ
jgi:Spy/CpxP family protein refolding chaperone